MKKGKPHKYINKLQECRQYALHRQSGLIELHDFNLRFEQNMVISEVVKNF